MTVEITRSYTMPNLFWLLPLTSVILTGYFLFQPYFLLPKILITLLCVVFLVYSARTPIRITVFDDRTVIFKGVFREIRISVGQIVSIQTGGRVTTIKLVDGRKIELSDLIRDLDDFLAMLHNLNPGIEEIDSPLAELIKSPFQLIVLIIGIVLLAVSLAVLALFLTA